MSRPLKRCGPIASHWRNGGNLTEACGEKGRKTIVQGKSHVNFVESNGKLYFATHIGYYSLIDGMDFYSICFNAVVTICVISVSMFSVNGAGRA